MKIFLPPFILGFATMVTQMALFRDFALLFSSNELIYSVLLSFWLVFTGAGSWVAGKMKVEGRSRIFLTALYSILSLFLWMAIPLIRSMLIPEGEAASPFSVMTAATIVLLPICFVSGMLFVIYSSSTDEKKNVRNVYFADVTGAVAGSLAYYFYLDSGYGPERLLIISVFLLSAVELFSALSGRKKAGRTGALVRLIPIPLIIAASPFIKQWHDSGQLPGQLIVENRDGLNGKYIVTKNGGQYNLYSSASFVFSSDYKLPAEEFVHTAMLQHPAPENILVINNYSPYIGTEILKYDPATVIFVETDPVKKEVADKYFPAGNISKCNVVFTDVLSFIDTVSMQFDVVMIQTGGVTSLGENRYFTQRFFSRIKNVMAPGAYLLMNWRSASDYYGGSFAEINGTIKKTVAMVFDSVRLFPFSSVYLVASEKGNMLLRPGEEAFMRGIDCEYFNPYYIDDNLLEQKANSLEKKISDSGMVNTEDHPVLFLNEMKLWLSQFRPYYFFIPLLTLLVFVLALAIRNMPEGMTMYITGFTTSSFMTLLLLMFVYVSGSMLRDISLFFAVSMTGMASGSLLGAIRPVVKKRMVLLLPLLTLALFPVCAAMLQNVIFDAGLHTARLIILMLLFLSGVSGGMVFSFYSAEMQGTNKKRSSMLYSHDMWGAFAGGLLCSLVMVPFLSASSAGIIISCLALMAFFINFIFQKK